MPSQSDERSCGRETDHNGSRWWKVAGLVVFGGQGKRWEPRGEVYGGVTGVEENITGTDEDQPDIQTDKQQAQMYCETQAATW